MFEFRRPRETPRPYVASPRPVEPEPEPIIPASSQPGLLPSDDPAFPSAAGEFNEWHLPASAGRVFPAEFSSPSEFGGSEAVHWDDAVPFLSAEEDMLDDLPVPGSAEEDVLDDPPVPGDDEAASEERDSSADTGTSPVDAIASMSSTTLNTEIPAAENPQIFELERVLKREDLRAEGLEVESRPEHSYPRVLPGSPRADEVRVEHHGVAVLQAATGVRGQVSTRGLGLWFPAHTVHARNSTAVVVGNNCELTQFEHVHIRQAVVSQDDALRSDRVKKIVARAEPGRDNDDVVRELRAALAELVRPPAEAGPARAERAVRADCTTSIHNAESVQIGNDATTRLHSRYVVERTTIPAGALLAEHEDLARRYVEIVADPADHPADLADFLCDLVGSAENTTDDNVLGYADGLPRHRATVLGLFGMTAVNHATSIMIGVGNELHTELDLTTARMRPDRSVADGLDKHRSARPATPPPAQPDPATPPPAQPDSVTSPTAKPSVVPAADVRPQPWATSDPPMPRVDPAEVGAPPSPVPPPWKPWRKPVDDDPADPWAGGGVFP